MTVSEARSILDRIVETKRRELSALAGHGSELRARAIDSDPARGFAAALRHPREVRLLAEVKRRSPSAGEIRPGADPVAIAGEYEAAGAAAVSVLTDREFFGGDLEFLRRVRASIALPVIRKDFMLAPVQIWEARAAGADAVLLIARILDDAQLVDLAGEARELGMDVLVEAHDRDELERALAVGTGLVGVNNRDLATFRTDLERSERLAAETPAAVTFVAESGIRTAADVRRLGAVGVDAVLVGESLMRQERVRDAAAALCGHPREAGARRT